MHRSGEDYLEAILQLSLEQESEEVRITDIAKKLGVAKSSVSRAINNLKEEGFVNQELYCDVYLTAKGKMKASQVYSRHKALTIFLVDILGVSKETADHDACLIEHDISSETMEKLVAFIEANRK